MLSLSLRLRLALVVRFKAVFPFPGPTQRFAACSNVDLLSSHLPVAAQGQHEEEAEVG